jgi:hypothetical protein
MFTHGSGLDLADAGFILFVASQSRETLLDLIGCGPPAEE